MKKIAEIAQTIAWLAIAVFFLTLTVELRTIRAQVPALLTHLNATVDETGLTMKAVRITAQTEQKNSEQQAQLLTKTEQQALDTLTSANAMIADLDTETKTTLAQAQQSLAQTSKAATDLATTTDAAVADTQAQLDTVVKGVMVQIDDPDISRALKETADATTSIAGSANDLHAATTEALQLETFYVDAAMKPVNVGKKFLGFFTWLAGRFFGY